MKNAIGLLAALLVLCGAFFINISPSGGLPSYGIHSIQRAFLDNEGSHGVGIASSMSHSLLTIDMLASLMMVGLAIVVSRKLLDQLISGFRGSVFLRLRPAACSQPLVDLTKFVRENPRSSYGDKLIERLEFQNQLVKPANTPRVLLKNPYGPETEGLPFEDRVDLAIEGSRLAGRVLGTIVIKLPEELGGDEPSLDATRRQVVSRLCRNLRGTDYVHVISDVEIAVFISLIKNRNRLQKIMRRLKHTATNTVEEYGYSAEIVVGMAMYPMGGYNAHDLIYNARCNVSSGSDSTSFEALKYASDRSIEDVRCPIPT